MYTLLDTHSRKKAFRQCVKTTEEWLFDDAKQAVLKQIHAEALQKFSNGDTSSLDLDLVLYADVLMAKSAYQIYVKQDFAAGMHYLQGAYRYKLLAHRFLLANEPRRKSRYRGYIGIFNQLVENLTFALFYTDQTAMLMLSEYANGINMCESIDLVDMPNADFIRHLAKLFLKRPVDTKTLPQTIHGHIIRTWNNHQQSQNIHALLDYHLAVATRMTGFDILHKKHYPDFYYSPGFDMAHRMLLPLEVMAMYSLRKLIGLPVNDKIDHPLFPNGFWHNISAEMKQTYSDDFIKQAEAFLPPLSDVINKPIKCMPSAAFTN
ncbi:MAG: hypothetical protein OEZ39_15995 [Gammaproteobacteria bacterium]|nr:hypothetical protein [Gammaproteobacteria bacterium]MDH5653360.1 hypothetical protein [Gammaproteobacteria bacterium]